MRLTSRAAASLPATDGCDPGTLERAASRRLLPFPTPNATKGFRILPPRAHFAPTGFSVTARNFGKSSALSFVALKITRVGPVFDSVTVPSDWVL
jgi:hypothetical protein